MFLSMSGLSLTHNLINPPDGQPYERRLQRDIKKTLVKDKADSAAK